MWGISINKQKYFKWNLNNETFLDTCNKPGTLGKSGSHLCCFLFCLSEQNRKSLCSVSGICEWSGVLQRHSLGRLEIIKPFFTVSTEESQTDLEK